MFRVLIDGSPVAWLRKVEDMDLLQASLAQAVDAGEVLDGSGELRYLQLTGDETKGWTVARGETVYGYFVHLAHARWFAERRDSDVEEPN